MFFFRKSEVTIDCFTYNPVVYDNFKIDIASKFYPKEFKELPNSYPTKLNSDKNSHIETSVATVRKCTGVTDLFSSGFIIPSWETFSAEATIDGKLYFNSNPSSVSGSGGAHHHSRIQYGDDIYKGWTHSKFMSPWLISEKTGINFTWNGCPWHRTDLADKMSVLSAVVDYKYQVVTHVNVFIKNGNIVTLNQGDPLVHMIPMSEKKVKIKHHLVSMNEWRSMQTEYQLYARYNNHRKLIIPRSSKCPFGFSK